MLLKKILLKIANINQAKFLYNVYNHSVENSFTKTKKKINYKDHLQWFKNNLRNKYTRIYIGYSSVKKFGYVRYEKIQKNEYIVSIANHPDFIGKGLGSILLKLSIKKFKKNRKLISIFAMIKKNNLPSKKIFIKNNFKLKKTIPKLLIKKYGKNFICYKKK